MVTRCASLVFQWSTGLFLNFMKRNCCDYCFPITSIDLFLPFFTDAESNESHCQCTGCKRKQLIMQKSEPWKIFKHAFM